MERLDEIRAREEKATEGWHLRPIKWKDRGKQLERRILLNQWGERIARTEYVVGTERGDQEAADLEFIAHAREDIPFLLAEIERLEKSPPL